jgi:hypothetical protein
MAKHDPRVASREDTRRYGAILRNPAAGTRYRTLGAAVFLSAMNWPLACSRHWRQQWPIHQPITDDGHCLRLPRLLIATQPPLAAFPVLDLGRVLAEHNPVVAFVADLGGVGWLSAKERRCCHDQPYPDHAEGDSYERN